MHITTRIWSAILGTVGQAVWSVFSGTGSGAEVKTASIKLDDTTPRRTTSACPWCHARALNDVLAGTMGEKDFERRTAYVIPAEIVHHDRQVWMQKVCPEHGLIVDLVSSDAAFTARIESLYRPQDPSREPPRGGRRNPSGLMLVVDLTNRCNMKCSPCFMDANHQTTSARPPWKTCDKFWIALLIRNRDGNWTFFSQAESRRSARYSWSAFDLQRPRFRPTSCGDQWDSVCARIRLCLVSEGGGIYGVFLQFDGLSNEANRQRHQQPFRR